MDWRRAEAIPIARELIPYLQEAIPSSPSELVFPNPDGTTMRPDVKLDHTLRRAMARAGIVEGYTHVCRKKGCGYKEEAKDAEPRRCPKHGYLLWPKGKVRHVRFHDLRHTTASLLMMAGPRPSSGPPATSRTRSTGFGSTRQGRGVRNRRPPRSRRSNSPPTPIRLLPICYRRPKTSR